MRYILDTDTCIYLINAQRARVAASFAKIPPGDVAVSTIVAAELAFGIVKSGSARNRERLEVFLSPLTIVAFDLAAALAYGDLRAELERRGTPIGPLDMLIASHALALKLVLVTNKEREFKRVPGLRVENWVRG
jgi:tRNA(fMet)-specific endonuclease VapC